ncbi:hypothetical protein AYI68_g4937 [Smittium mucronatum]|uniref:Uncharacterized protein n=1 Tax=Smittium mucronatum TaxID=133383 RepID=A0A1R0GVP9_9FUNG|nr:hypothetical protein AYI68_g4937 [Smittium mucronatum]
MQLSKVIDDAIDGELEVRNYGRKRKGIRWRNDAVFLTTSVTAAACFLGSSGSCTEHDTHQNLSDQSRD